MTWFSLQDEHGDDCGPGTPLYEEYLKGAGRAMANPMPVTSRFSLGSQDTPQLRCLDKAAKDKE